jgi:hypothetical protein
MYPNQELETDEERSARIQQAFQSVKSAQQELTESAPGVLGKVGLGSVAVLIAIYWLLIKR